MDTVWSWMLRELKHRGWTQNRYFDDAGRTCLLGAYRAVTGGSLLWNAVHEAKLIKAIYGTEQPEEYRFHPVSAWNDDPNRTFAEVCELLTQLHEDEISSKGDQKAMDIGEPLKEVEFEPIEAPSEAPVEPVVEPAPAETPVEAPADEPVPA